MKIIRRLVSFSRKHYRIFFIAVLASLLASLLDVTFLYLIKQCTDRHHMSQEFTPLVIVLSLLCLVVFRSVFNYMAEIGLFKFGRNVIMDLRNVLYQQLLSIRVSDVEQRSSGDLTTKLIYQSDQLGNGLLNISKSVLQEGLVIIVFIIALLCMNFTLTIIVLITLGVIAYGVKIAAEYMRSHQFAVQDRLTELAHFMDQTKHAIKTVCMQNVQKEMSTCFSGIVNKHAEHQLKINRASALSSGVIHFVISLPLTAIIWLVFVFPDWASPGDFAALIFGFSRIYAPMKRVSRLNVDLQSAIAAGESLFAWFDLKPERRDGHNMEVNSPPSIKIEGVSVVMNEKHILSNCSLDIAPGSVVAFAGETASGKTTLLQLVAGLVTPSSGEFLLNDMSIDQINLTTWRQQIGFVDQSLPLFNMTIAENVAFFDEVDLNRVKWACHLAAIDHEIETFKHGYDQVIEYGGSNLSGGQRQRIVLARALYYAKHILIIDEATSALDNETEQLIYSRIRQLSQLTILLSSHRVAGLQFADRVIVLDHGEIVQDGQYDALVEQSGRLRQLIGKQNETMA